MAAQSWQLLGRSFAHSYHVRFTVPSSNGQLAPIQRGGPTKRLPSYCRGYGERSDVTYPSRVVLFFLRARTFTRFQVSRWPCFGTRGKSASSLLVPLLWHETNAGVRRACRRRAITHAGPRSRLLLLLASQQLSALGFYAPQYAS